MKYKISKAKVIEAICTEPLSSGNFFSLVHSSMSDIDDGKCSVCAIGAILRKTKPKTFSSTDAMWVTDHVYISDFICAAYEDNNFLSILSCEYEEFCLNHPHDKDEQRFHALMVAEAFCPDVLEFEV